MTAASDRLTFRAPPARVRFSLFPHVQPIVFKEKLTMKTDSLMEEKLECSLWCCLSDLSIPGRCCVLERRIVPWMQQLHQQWKWLICGLCRLYNLPKHPNVEMPDQPLPMGQNGTTEEVTSKEEEEEEMDEDIEDLGHYEMKEEPTSEKKLEDEGTEKENWAILEKIRKTERQGHLNVLQCLGQCKLQIDLRKSSGTYTDHRVIRQVDPDSPLHSDLQILKEKEEIGDILLMF
ncbi:ubiquitin-conjugating enzyme E2 Q2-like [Pan troglodytes]|uniref:ubiquitin-conjugating enzyme E2 Q2-like n=1 Tax=Pan troglodytes TaxID=9598 RepID=UPI000512030A|nr:ubiquitin-conjugating enzyme E2 Q2-like [Pan troglodytes]